MKKLKQLITNNYKEPDDHGKFVDLTEELLPELIQQMSLIKKKKSEVRALLLVGFYKRY